MEHRPHSIEITDEDFQREVIDRSVSTPVVVDFWAPWCGPCRTLGPLLERLAHEHAGDFVLAKLNVDPSSRVADRLKVDKIPTVLGFRDGEVRAHMIGAKSEPEVRRFLADLLPTQADESVAAALLALESSDPAAAEERFRAALALEGRHPEALLGLARLLGERGEREEALALLERFVPGDEDEREATQLAAELRVQAAGGDDEARLQARVEADSDDLDARVALGRALAARRRYEPALEMLVEAVRRDPGFDDEAARKAMLDIFEVLGSDDERTQRFRRELARALYR